VQVIQDRTYELRNIALDAVVQLTRDIGAVARRDSTDARLAEARLAQRRAQFLVDFIEAENSMGFHASQEGARVLAHALEHARRGQRVLAGQSNAPVPRTGAPMRSPSAARR
jgi:nitrite reductase (cytochrome c-552)